MQLEDLMIELYGSEYCKVVYEKSRANDSMELCDSLPWIFVK